MTDYILVTPIRNEEKNLPHILDTILEQSIRPQLWVFVYDESQDNSESIIKDFCERYDWIEMVKDERKKPYWLGYGMSVGLGFEYAIREAKKYGIKYSYLGLCDADVKLDNDYFEVLIEEFKKNEKYGILSGYQYFEKEGIELPVYRINKAEGCAGPARLYRKETFHDIGGFPSTPSPDTVSDIKAMLRGWKVNRISRTKFIHTRENIERRSFIGMVRAGEGRYMLNYHPVNALLSSIYLSLKPPYVGGILFLYGYLSSYVFKKEKIEDEEIKKFFRHATFNNLKRKMSAKSLFEKLE